MNDPATKAKSDPFTSIERPFDWLRASGDTAHMTNEHSPLMVSLSNHRFLGAA